MANMRTVWDDGKSAAEFSKAIRNGGMSYSNLEMVLPDGQRSPYTLAGIQEYEKASYLAAKAAKKITTTIRGRANGGDKEWDHILYSLNKTESDTLRAQGKQTAVVDALIAGARKGTSDDRFSHAVVVSVMHDDTGNMHIHLWRNRFGLDLEAKEVSTSNSSDLTKEEYRKALRERVNAELEACNLPLVKGFDDSKGRPGAAKNAVSVEAIEAARDDVAKVAAGSEAAIADAPGMSPDDALVRRVDPSASLIDEFIDQRTKDAAALDVQMKRLQEQRAAAVKEIAHAVHAKAAIQQRDDALQARDTALQEKAGALQERDEALQARDTALQEKAGALQERDEALQARDASEAEKDQALQQLQATGARLAEAQEKIEAISADLETVETERDEALAELEREHERAEALSAELEHRQQVVADLQQRAAQMQQQMQQERQAAEKDKAEALDAQKIALNEIHKQAADALRESMQDAFAGTLDAIKQQHAEQLRTVTDQLKATFAAELERVAQGTRELQDRIADHARFSAAGRAMADHPAPAMSLPSSLSAVGMDEEKAVIIEQRSHDGLISGVARISPEGEIIDKIGDVKEIADFVKSRTIERDDDGLER